jgi:hypothetical protein
MRVGERLDEDDVELSVVGLAGDPVVRWANSSAALLIPSCDMGFSRARIPDNPN